MFKESNFFTKRLKASSSNSLCLSNPSFNFNFSKFSIVNVSVFPGKATLIKNTITNKKLYLTKLIKFDLTYYWVEQIESKFCCYH